MEKQFGLLKKERRFQECEESAFGVGGNVATYKF